MISSSSYTSVTSTLINTDIKTMKYASFVIISMLFTLTNLTAQGQVEEYKLDET